MKCGILKTVFSVTGVIFLAKLMGFVKQAATAAAFGVSIDTDLISLSEGFIGNLHYVLVQVLLTSFTATYIHTRERDTGAAERMTIDVIKAFSMIALGLSAAVMPAAPLIARIIAPSYTPEISARLTAYLRLFAPVLVLFVWLAVFHALLNANQRFIPGELVGLNQSVIVIVLIFTVGNTLGPRVLAISFFIYHIWNTLYLGVLSRRYWRFSRGNPFQNESVQQLLRMAVPLLLGYSMVYINQQVDKALSSGLEQGTVTAMSYAAVLSNLVGTFIGSFCSVLYTNITGRIAQNDHIGAAGLAAQAAALLMLAFAPISVLTFLCAEDIVTIVYGRGSFDTAAIRVTALALRGYALTFVPLVLRELFSRFQYGYQDTRRPMINSTCGIAVNIVLSIILCPVLGVFGITLASSASVLVCSVLNALFAQRHNRFLSLRPLLELLPWLATGSMLCALAAWKGMELLPGASPVFRFVLSTVLGFCAYLPAVLWPLLRLIRKKT